MAEPQSNANRHDRLERGDIPRFGDDFIPNLVSQSLGPALESIRFAPYPDVPLSGNGTFFLKALEHERDLRPRFVLAIEDVDHLALSVGATTSDLRLSVSARSRHLKRHLPLKDWRLDAIPDVWYPTPLELRDLQSLSELSFIVTIRVDAAIPELKRRGLEHGQVLSRREFLVKKPTKSSSLSLERKSYPVGHLSGMALSNEYARRIVLESRQFGQCPLVLSSHIEVVGGAYEVWNTQHADEVVERLTPMKDELLGEERSISKDQKFDRAACRIIHQGLKLPLNLAAEDGFWRWLAVDKFYQIIEARHNRTSEHAGLGNFGIDSSADYGRLKILWLRADIVYDAENDDPYHLSDRLSPTDFWESGIIRHQYGWAPNLARALVGFQYPDPDSGKGTLHLTHENGIRMLYKRLRQLHTTVAFEYLDDSQLFDLLTRLSERLERG